MTDQRARDVHYLHAFPLLPLTGAQHVPLICNVLKVWTPLPTMQTPGWSRAQRKELYLQWSRQDSNARALQSQVTMRIEQLPDTDCDRLHEVHTCLNQFDEFKTPSSNKHPVYEFDATPFQAFQQHTRSLRQMSTTGFSSLAHLFQAWFHVAKRQAARRQMNLTAKAARKSRIDQIFAQADKAERAQDSFQFYQAIRELAPKQSFRRIQLRSATGALLGPADAADSLCDWYRELYSAQDEHSVSQNFSWPFSEAEFRAGLQRLPSFKALAPDYAPAPIWQAAATSAAAYLQPYFEYCSSFGSLPSCWSNGVLTFLCKPGKPGRSPAELRPIALLEPSGKVLMGLVAKYLLHSMSERLFRLPVFAYLPGRGGDEAITRVRKHCSDVRTLLHTLRFGIHRAAHSVPGPELAGGLVLSLDLTKAFDSVVRSKLFQALTSLGADRNIIAMLSQIYDKTSFSFWHRGQYRSLPTQRGIRQGCKAAPILWTLFSAWILENAAQINGWEWLCDVVTAFADDFCLHSLIESMDDFSSTLTKVGAFLDLLIDAGLTINRDKTIATLKLHGPGKVKIYKRFIKRTKDGTFICIPSRHGQPFFIRLVSQFSYLGVILSYSNFELLTVRHRIKAGVKISHQLQRWLFKKTGLSHKQKVKLWFQCTFPCLTYGLRSIGLTPQTVQLLDRTFLQQLRRLCHSPVHLTHLAHVDFLDSAGIADPLQRLLTQIRKARQRESDRTVRLQPADILHRCYPLDPLHLEQVLLEVYEQRRDSSTLHQAEYAPHACPLCSMSFTNISLLRRHQLLEHGCRSGLLRISSSRITSGRSHMSKMWQDVHSMAQFSLSCEVRVPGPFSGR